MRVFHQEFLDSVLPCKCFWQELKGLFNPVVRLCTAESEETLASFTKTFTAQASYTKVIVGTFECVHRQAMRGDSKPVANFADFREYIKSSLWSVDIHAGNFCKSV